MLYIYGGVFLFGFGFGCFCLFAFFFYTKEFLKISVRPNITEPKLNFSESEIQHLGIGK